MSVSLYGSGQTVLQVVQSSAVTTSISTSSSTFVTSGITASITPQNTTSKILVLANTSTDNNGSGNQMVWTIYRGGSNLLDGGSTSGNGFGGAYGSASRIITPASGCFLDSPSTTSSITYTMYFRSISGTVYLNSSANAFITLLEISGS